MLNQQVIREGNLKKVFDIIRSGSHVSRADLSVATSITKPAVSSIVEYLISGRYIREREDLGYSAPGRRPISLEVDDSYHVIASIHWERNFIAALIIDLDGGIVEKKVSSESGLEDVLALISWTVATSVEKGMNLLGVCIILPALILSSPVLIYSTVLSGFSKDGRKEIEAIKEKVGKIPVCFVNDTACNAYEYKVEASIRSKDWLYVNVSNGIGAVAFHDGAMFRGAGGEGLQLGHFSIDRSGPPCPCGNRGCLELMVGGLALGRRYGEFGFSSALDFDSLARYLEDNDERAINLVDTFASEFAFALSSLSVMHNPAGIYIGGEAYKMGDRFLSVVVSRLKECSFMEFTKHLDIRFVGKERKESVHLGAVRYFFDKHYSFQNLMDTTVFFG